MCARSRGWRSQCQSQHDVPRVAAALAAAKKKSLHDSARDTARVKGLRADYLEQIASFVLARVKFIDETGINVGLTRLYGRATPGVRVVEAVPGRSGTRLTLLAAIGLSDLSAPWVIEGAVDGAVFELYLREILSPTLTADDIVIMDNLSVDKVAGVKAARTACGARLEYLPPYSPDFKRD